MADNYYPLLQAVQTIVNGLNLQDWNNRPVPNAIRKLPKVDESIDALPLLCIVPKNEPPARQTLAFGPSGTPYYKVTYRIEVVWIVGGDRDFTSNLSTYTAWDHAIQHAFDSPASLKAKVSSVWDVNVRPGLIIDRSQVNDNYDYGGLTIEPITSELD